MPLLHSNKELELYIGIVVLRTDRAVKGSLLEPVIVQDDVFHFVER